MIFLVKGVYFSHCYHTKYRLILLKKIFFLFSFLFFLTELSYSQSVNIPSLALEGIEFSVEVNNIPDSVKSIRLTFQNEDYIKSVSVPVKNGKAATSQKINETGNFILTVEGIKLPTAEVRVIPGILSIIPPLLAIALALLFREVIISLLIGIFVGALFIYDYNIFVSLLRVIDTYVINALSEKSHIQVVVFTLLFGGVIGLISKSGGTKGIANVVTKFARTRRLGMISTWLSGIIIFFDDYSNSLIVGNLMRPITDKMRISREKLSFIVDSTAAPVSSIFIISSWIGFEIGLIQDGLNSIGSSQNAYDVFIQTIQFRFYPIAMLVFVFLISYFRRDFGPMYSAERRAVEENKLLRDNANVPKDFTDSSDLFGNEEKAKWYNGLVPILVLIFGTMAGLILTGINSLEEQGITDYGLRDIIGNSDSYSALLWSSFIAAIVAGIMIASQKIMNLTETVNAWFTGTRTMFLAVVILSLAWGIGAVTQDIKTADYIVSTISDTINPRYLPVLVFLLCALTSWATGTSWGTMAIMMPIVIPLSDGITATHNFSGFEHSTILYGVISSVLAGSVFGDHCSPISDTTILSSMASGCDHIDHVRTQLPYAIVVAIVCMLIGDIPTAFGFPPFLSIILIVLVLIAVLFFVGNRVEPSTSIMKG